MRYGKASKAVMDRSVIRPLKRSGQYDPAVGENMSMQIDTLGGCFDPTLNMQLSGAVNDLLAKGADPSQLCCSIGLLVPEDMSEDALREIIDGVASFARREKIRIAGGHTAVSPSVSAPVMSIQVSCMDQASDERGLEKDGSKPDRAALPEGCQLIMTGYAGWAGTSVLARYGAKELKQRFPAVFVEEAIHFEDQLLLTDVCASVGNKAVYMTDISRGGVFASLWDLAEQTGAGMNVDLRAIPIRQETIEICEYYDLNPYQLHSCGASLIVADAKSQIPALLAQNGIDCAVIGEITKGPGKILRNGEEIRYLDKPAQDMLSLMAERLKKQ